jgi:hypothetical protein
MKMVESKELDSTIASFAFENALSFKVVDSPSFAVMVDQCMPLWLLLEALQPKRPQAQW